MVGRFGPPFRLNITMALTKINFGQIDTTTREAEIVDPILLLNKSQAGDNTEDSGIIIERGDETNVGIIWDESAGEFALILTTDTGNTLGNVSISSYADLRAGNIYANSDLVVGGNLTVNGTTLTINSTDVSIDDLNLTLAAGSANATVANGAGITVDGADARITYIANDNSWKFNIDVEVLGNIDANVVTANTFTGNLSGSATTAGTVTTNAQPNITSVGNLETLTVVGNLSAGNISNVSTASVTNLLSSNVTASSALQVTSTTISTSTSTGAMVVTGGAGIGGNLYLGGQLNVQGLISGNIASSGTSTFATITANTLANITSTTESTSKTTGALVVAGGVGVVGNLNANVFYGSALGLTNIPAANISGTVANAAYATDAGNAVVANTAITVTANAQPNITSVGTLSSLVMSGNLDMGNAYILNVPAPTATHHPANKAYVDEVAEGLKAKPAAELATTGPLTATYNNGTAGTGATLTATTNGAFPIIDGVTLTSTTPGLNGVLVKNQTDPAENGRYNLTQQGDETKPWILTRCGICDNANEIPGSYVFVKAGTLYGGTGWTAYVDDPSTFTVGTDDITWFQFSGVGTYTAGTGLTLAGTEFSVNSNLSHVTTVGNLGSLSVTGNVAIGNITATESLHVSGNVRITGAIKDSNNTAGTAGYVLSTTGTGTEWVSAQSGYTGSQGAMGYTGSQGVVGYTGSIGYTGSQGDTGYTGSQGEAGYTGSRGSDGTIGVDGYTGSKGDIGYTGSQGIQGIQGFTGSQGDIGYTGSAGFTGSQGDIGYTGSNGDQGVIGYTGSQGIQGSIGYTGSKGSDGTIGVDGYTGSQGEVGYTGSQGDIGYAGSQGVEGYTGSIGYTGSQGDTGYSGSQGEVGYTGSTGDQGDLGYTGSQGDVGYTGSQGIQGDTGFTGSQGGLGYTGSAGPGVAAGGTTGQVLAKNSNSDYDTAWVNVSGGTAGWIKKTTTYTALAGDKIIADTSGGTFTITLPATPAEGDVIEIADGADWATTNLTVARNGSTIEGLSEDIIFNIKGASVRFIYDGTTWEIFVTIQTNPAISDDNSTDGTRYLTFVDTTSGSQTFVYVASSKLYFNPSTGDLSATNFNSLSDLRYKQNIQQIKNGAAVIEQLRPVSFDWRDSGRHSHGVIAQEIEQILPDAVTENEFGIKTVSYSQIIPFLISAVHELQDQIAELKEQYGNTE